MAELRGRRIQRVLLKISDNDRCAVGEELLSNAEADTSTAAGDDSDLAVHGEPVALVVTDMGDISSCDTHLRVAAQLVIGVDDMSFSIMRSGPTFREPETPLSVSGANF